MHVLVCVPLQQQVHVLASVVIESCCKRHHRSVTTDVKCEQILLYSSKFSWSINFICEVDKNA